MNQKANPPDQSLPVSELIEVHKVCQQFEAGWKAGRQPKAADFLGDTPEPKRSELKRELEAIEAEYRQKSKKPTLDVFIETLAGSGLMTRADVQNFLTTLPADKRPADAERLAREMFKQGKLTKFQAQAIYQGKTRGLVVGNYVVLDKLGQGGMGQVYKVQHRKMKRIVAVKMLPSSATKSPDAVKRFQREVEAAAKLSHPNIVTAHDADESGGVNFLVMEHVDGQDLSALVKGRGPLSLAQAVDCAVQAANGLEYAHRQGVVHRDIKPSNLLLDKGGTVKILDMGLARIEDAVGGADDGLTHSGQVMGTLDYMAPEQAFDTHHADARSDIYSLGCTLHYLLTGRAPFAGDSMTQKILAHREQPVPSLRVLRPDVPEWLDGVFQKMLTKRPEERQQTMGEVMTQLQQQVLPQTGSAVSVRPSPANVAETLNLRQGHVETSSEQVQSPALPPREGRGEGNEDALAFLSVLGKRAEADTPLSRRGRGARGEGVKTKLWSRVLHVLPQLSRRRKIAVATAAGLVFVFVLLGVILKLLTKEGTLVVEIDDPNVTVQVLDGEGKVQIQRPGEKDKLSIAVDPGKHRLRVEKNGVELFAKDFTMASGGTEIIKASWEPPVANPGSQSRSGGAGQLPPVAITPPADARPCPVDNLRREDIPADELAAAGGGDPSKAPAELVAIFGDSRLKHSAPIFTVGYSGDGKTLFTRSVDGTACLWDAATGKLRRSVEGSMEWWVHPVSLSRDGKLLATGCDDKSVKLWDAETGRLLWALDKQVGIITSLAFSPDGQFLAVATDATSGKLVVWDVGARRPHRTFKVNASNVRCVVFSPDGKTLAAGSGLSSGPKEGWGGWLQLWEMVSGNELLNFKGHGGMVSGVAFSPDGKTLASASGDATVKLWNTVTATEIRTLDTHPGKVVRVAFSRDGKTVALIPPHDGGPVRIWDVGTDSSPVYRFADGSAYTAQGARFTLPDSSYGAAFSPDGKTLATANYNGMVRLWDPATGQERPESALLAKPPWWWYYGSCLLAISPNGATLACATHRPQFRLWDLASGKPKAALDGERLADWVGGDTGHWSATAFSPDNRLLATGDHPGTIRIWDLATGKAIKILAGRGPLIHALVFSPDGKILASGSQGKAIELWDLASRELRLNLEGHQGSVRALAISKDGRLLASGSDDKTIKLWDLTTGQLRATLSGHGAALGSLAFSADGKTLYSAGGTVKLWDLASNEVRLSLEAPGGAGLITLSPDDKTLAIVGGDGTVGLRDARNGRPREVIRVGPNAGIFQVAFTPDGRHLVTFNRNGTIYVLRLPDLRSDAPSPVPAPAPGIPPPAVAPFDEKKAKGHQAAWAKYLGVPVEITNSIGMKLALIPPGEFEMGSPPELIVEQLKVAKGDTWGLEHLPSEGPRHHVRITRPFYLGMYPVTQEEYQRVIGANPSEFSATGKGKDRAAGQDTKRFPVENVSWQDTDDFCSRLSEMREEKSAGRRYRLPSEAQWEYACRAGSTGRYFFSPVSDDKKAAENLLSEYAWFGNNAGGRPHAVGGRRASPWGLYDMYGNVAVWCQDWYAKDYYAKSPADDPAGPPGGSNRVHRGGYWFSPAGYCRSAHHLSDGPWLHACSLGFRVSLVLADTAGRRKTVPSAESSVPSPQAPAPIPNPQSPAPAIAPFDEKKAKEHQEGWAKHLGAPVELTNSIGMKLVLIPPGEFTMGSPKEVVKEELQRHGGDSWYRRRLPGEVPQHHVRITKAFWFAVTPVTQEEYQRVMGFNPSKFRDDPKRPAEQVSWNEATEFCRKLSELPAEKAARRRYQLPTEAQWEYACRAGSTTRFWFGDDERLLGEYGWFSGNSGGQTHLVGQKKPNAWGLYDVCGNVWQWCADWHDENYYKVSPESDPTGPISGARRVQHGGSWHDDAGYCRSADRNDDGGNGDSFGHMGLRASLVLPDTAAERAKMSRATDTAQPSDGSTANKPLRAVTSPDTQSPGPNRRQTLTANWRDSSRGLGLKFKVTNGHKMYSL